MSAPGLSSVLAQAREAGARPIHERRMLRAWLATRSLRSALETRRERAPARLLERCAELERELGALVRGVEEHPSADGSVRLLLELADGQKIESVLLPRGVQCISTQIGCAVGCVFCETGRYGLVRQLSSAEMLAQVVEGRRRRPVRRVVLMGMGEPAHNLAAVLEALERLHVDGGIARENLAFSTVGERAAFDALAASAVQPQLSLSLHTLDAERRAQLLPRAPRIEPRELVELADAYARSTGRPWQLQWVLLAGRTDAFAEFEALAELLRGRMVIVNLIPFNPVDGSGCERPELVHAQALMRLLISRGVRARLRRSGGPDVEAACGQLRARAAERRR